MTNPIKISRRHLLGATAGLLATAGLNPTLASAQQAAAAAAAPAASKAKPLPAYVSWKDADSMIIHTPTTIETKRAAIICPHLQPPTSVTSMPGKLASKALANHRRSRWAISSRSGSTQWRQCCNAQVTAARCFLASQAVQGG